jgi:arylsulfatase
MFEWLRDAGHDWIQVELRREDLTAASHSGEVLYAAPLGLRAAPAPPGMAPQQLEASGAASFRYANPENKERHFRLPAGTFAVARDVVLIAPHAGEPVPAGFRLRIYAGAANTTRPGRFAIERFAGDGVALAPGDLARWRGAIPESSALRFASCVAPALARGDSPREAPRLRIRGGGEVLFDEAIAPRGESAQRWHELPLRHSGGRETSIEFALLGGFARVAIAAPVIGPAADVAGEPRARAADPRPDLLLFVADTFRADNLEPYGDTLNLAPFLSGLAEQGRWFRRAYSVATHTLPAHASLFTGLTPHRAGMSSQELPLPPGIDTLAELLAAQGYRTGAVTDALFVSQRYGLDRGFEWFDELQASLASTRERALAFLDSGDGRPQFLFVQTYRTHFPYHVSARTRSERGAELGIDASSEELNARVHALGAAAASESARGDTNRASIARSLRALYRGSVIDLDRELRGLHTDLRARGIGARGVFAFTSDHGEAFDEHGRLFHAAAPHEEQIRIPLFLTGPGIEAAAVEEPATLLDVAPTLARLAAVEVPSAWAGRSLLGPLGERPVLAFESAGHAQGALALVSGARKLLSFESRERIARGELLAAYDLARDPGEQRDALAGGESWPAELLAAHASALAAELEPVPAALAAPRASPAAFDAELRESLRALGYATESMREGASDD